MEAAHPTQDRLRRPVAVSLGASGAIQLLNVVTGVALARELGPALRGELTATMLWPALLAAIGSLGVTEATTFHTARRTASVTTLVCSALALCAVQSVLLVGIGAAIVPLVLTQYGAGALGTGYLFLAFIPLNLVTLYLLAVLNGLERFGRLQVLRTLVIACSAGGILALALAGSLTVRDAVIVYLAANLVTAVTAFVLVRPEVSMQDRKWSGTCLRQILGYAIRSHSSNVTSMLNERLDQLVVSLFLAPTKLGLYVVAVTMTSVTTLIGSSVSVVALPVVARAADERQQAERAQRLVSFTFAASVAITVPLIAFMPQLLTLFFGEAFRPAANVARVLLVAAVALSTNRTVSTVLRALNRPLVPGFAELLALGVTVAALATLLPLLGLLGAGVASLLAYVVSTAWMVTRVRRALNLSLVGLMLPVRRRKQLDPAPA